jgi:hypothetical protein
MIDQWPIKVVLAGIQHLGNIDVNAGPPLAELYSRKLSTQESSLDLLGSLG